MEAIASRLEAAATRVEAIAIRTTQQEKEERPINLREEGGERKVAGTQA